jgi:hypothetical protein
MSTQELAAEHPVQRAGERRVVEVEVKLPKFEDLHLPKFEDVKLPKIDLEPARAITEQVLLTGLGFGVLLVRGLVGVVKAANEAGVQAAQHPGPVTKAVLGLVRQGEGPTSDAATDLKIKVPMLPIGNYDALATDQILAQLTNLTDEQLCVVREYELDHQARAEVLEAIAQRLSKV